MNIAPSHLATSRLDLRPLVIEDAQWYLAHFSRPEIVHGSGFPAPADREAAAAELRLYVLDLIANGTGMRWGMVARGHEGLIGSIGYYKFVEQPVRQAEIGYDLAPEHWGKGYMGEALDAVITYLLGPLGLERIEALVLPHNTRSMRLLERAGFVREALLPAHGTDEHGDLTDEVLYVLTPGARRSG